MKINIIYGSPCSGKSTYVNKIIGEKDIRFDYDLILQALTNHKNRDEISYSSSIMQYIFAIRKKMINSYADSEIENAYIITTKISDTLEQQLVSIEAEYKLIETTKEECYSQLQEDTTRPNKEFWKPLIDDWFAWFDSYKAKKAGNIRNYIQHKQLEILKLKSEV